MAHAHMLLGRLRKRTPGWQMFEVPIRDERGRSRDAGESRATFAGEPWAKKARYLGFRDASHYWERPPT